MTLPTFATVQSGSIALDTASPGSLIRVSQGTVRKRFPRENITATGDGINSRYALAKRPTYWFTGVGWLVDDSGNFLDTSLAASITGSLIGRISNATIRRTTNVIDVSAAGDFDTVDTVPNTLYSVWAPGTSTYEGSAHGFLQSTESILGRSTDYPLISDLEFPIGGTNLAAAAVVDELSFSGSFREGGVWEGDFDFAITGGLDVAPPFGLASSNNVELYLSNGYWLIGSWISSLLVVQLDYKKGGRIPVSFAGPFTGPVSNPAD